MYPDPGDVTRLIRAAAKLNRLLPSGCGDGRPADELRALRWKHVDSDKRPLGVARTIVEIGGELIETDTKRHQVRKLTVGEGTAAVLSAHRLALRCRNP